MTKSAHRMFAESAAGTKLLYLTMVAGLAIWICACASQRSGNVATSVIVKPPLNPPADIGWVSAGGGRATLADYRNRVLVLDFYATWCAPCRQSIPRLIALQKIYGAQGLQIVGLNVGGADDRVKVANFARELSIQYPLGFPDKSLTDLFLSDNQTIPQTFIFDRDGQLLKRFIGYDPAGDSELERIIGEAVSNHKSGAH